MWGRRFGNPTSVLDENVMCQRYCSAPLVADCCEGYVTGFAEVLELLANEGSTKGGVHDLQLLLRPLVVV